MRTPGIGSELEVGVFWRSGRFVGVVSDGDLRRALERDGNIIDEKASDIMTIAPKRVSPGMMAAEALKLMEDEKITSLFVDGDAERPSGFIHLHDLLQRGVV